MRRGDEAELQGVDVSAVVHLVSRAKIVTFLRPIIINTGPKFGPRVTQSPVRRRLRERQMSRRSGGISPFFHRTLEVIPAPGSYKEIAQLGVLSSTPTDYRGPVNIIQQ